MEETPTSTTSLESINVVNPGYGYTSTPTVNILGDGFDATATATISNGRLSSIEITNVGYGYTEALAEIVGGGGQLGAASVVLAGNSGTIRTYYYDNGVKTILDPTAGTVDYGNGIVVLDSFLPSDVNNSSGVLSLQAVPNSTIISSSRDKIIALDNTDSNAINVKITAKS